MSIELNIVTPEGQAFSGSVEQVVLPGSEGEFGVLAEHERYLAPLRPGTVEIREGGRSQWAAVSEGFAEVNAESVVVLVDRCALAGDVDVEAARSARADAESQLKDIAGDDNEGRERAEGLIAYADAEIAIAQR